jgi:hypothetical protein
MGLDSKGASRNFIDFLELVDNFKCEVRHFVSIRKTLVVTRERLVHEQQTDIHRSRSTSGLKSTNPSSLDGSATLQWLC